MAVLNFDIKSVSLPDGSEAKAVFLSGSIDASTNQQFEDELNNILSSGTNKVLLVLTNVKYINSTGLGTIVKCVDTFRESDGDIKLVGVPTKVIALFEMLGLLALFETHDSIEDAVTSFGGDAAGGGDEESKVSFPLQFKHPKTGMGLNVSQPGRFKDPRSGDYFNVDASGKVEFYETNKIKVVEVKFPCESIFAPGITALASSLADSAGLGDDAGERLERSIDEVCSVISRNGSAADTCNVLLVSNGTKVQIGFVSHSDALNIPQDDPALLVIKNDMTEVKHHVLPTKGHLLNLVLAP